LFEYFPHLLSEEKHQFNDLIELFLEETSHRIGDLRDAHKMTDIELARNAAHTMKGTSHTFGAMRLVNLAIQVENELLSGRIEY
jgi:HPt (histidine-containing phosphotransfer) domain-containing protein